jgi:hypothetical protein
MYDFSCMCVCVSCAIKNVPIIMGQFIKEMQFTTWVGVLLFLVHFCKMDQYSNVCRHK